MALLEETLFGSHDKVAIALQRLRTFEPPEGYYLAFSGGKDSQCVYHLCKEAGVVMTPAGATYPYGIDPNDSNIRIAPSLPPVEELEKAMDVFCTCLKLAALEKLMNK